MTVLVPLGLAGLSAIPILVLFYLLKVRRRDYEVSSTYLWEQLVRDLAAHEPWQRLHMTVLLLIQIILLALLALALARPAFPVLARDSLYAVVVVDATASMQASDVAPSRFARAQAEAIQAIEELPAGSTVTLIAARAHADVLAAGTRDLEQAAGQVQRLQAGSVVGDPGEALRLALALAQGRSNGLVYVFSDGAFDLPADFPPPTVPVRYVQVAADAGNRAVTALTVRPDPADPRRQVPFTSIRNFSARPATTSVALLADGQTVEVRPVVLPGDGEQNLVFGPLAETVQTVEVRLQTPDELAVDDTAAIVLEHRRPTQVLLVSRGNLFLEKMLGLLPNLELYRAQPGRYDLLDTSPYDLIVFDGYLPEQLPRRNLLVVNPPNTGTLPAEGLVRQPPLTYWNRDDPVLRYADLDGVKLARATRLSPPSWLIPLVESEGMPLVLRGETQGRRMVVFGFDLQQSNLPVSTAFPIMMANIRAYLEPPGALSATTVSAGSPVTVYPGLPADRIEIKRPDGSTTTLPASGQPISIPATDQVGLYTIDQRAGERTLASDSFAVNLTAAAESDPRPRVDAGRLAGPPEPADPPHQVPREIWWWVAAAAAAVLTGEWWWYHRRA